LILLLIITSTFRYIPRLYFVDVQGKIRSEIINEKGHPSYKYFYSTADAVVEGMKAAAKKLSA